MVQSKRMLSSPRASEDERSTEIDSMSSCCDDVAGDELSDSESHRNVSKRIEGFGEEEPRSLAKSATLAISSTVCVCASKFSFVEPQSAKEGQKRTELSGREDISSTRLRARRSMMFFMLEGGAEESSETARARMVRKERPRESSRSFGARAARRDPQSARSGSSGYSLRTAH